jgi:hypothetical protein
VHLSEKVIDLADRRPKVHYTVRLTQGWNGSLSVFVEDTADDTRSRLAVAQALRDAAALIEANIGKRDG